MSLLHNPVIVILSRVVWQLLYAITDHLNGVLFARNTYHGGLYDSTLILPKENKSTCCGYSEVQYLFKLSLVVVSSWCLQKKVKLD